MMLYDIYLLTVVDNLHYFFSSLSTVLVIFIGMVALINVIQNIDRSPPVVAWKIVGLIMVLAVFTSLAAVVVPSQKSLDTATDFWFKRRVPSSVQTMGVGEDDFYEANSKL